jgi:hypothetical protein
MLGVNYMPDEAYPELVETPLFDDEDKRFLNRRLKLIEEASGWGDGWHEVDRLEGGLVVGFKKPGKFRDEFPHDMTPVLKRGDTECPRWDMKDVWVQLCRVGMVDWEAFKALLVLIYRNAYLFDHTEDEAGRLRYRPPKSAIDRLEGAINRAKVDMPCGVLGLLHFLNLLGWNEDMKYNVKDGKPSFDEVDSRGRVVKKNYARGRVNNLLTCIRVPFEVTCLIKGVRARDVGENAIESAIDTILDIAQKFVHTRGLCPPDSKQQLVEWLKPYLTGRPPFQESLERWMT